MTTVQNNSAAYFNSFSKAALYNIELIGQFSDGHWENSSNRNWEWYGKAEVTNGVEHITVDNKYLDELDTREIRNYRKYRNYSRPRYINRARLDSGYGCNSTILITHIGARMLAFAHYGKAFEKTEIVYALQSFLEDLSSRAITGEFQWCPDLDIKGEHKNAKVVIDEDMVNETITRFKELSEKLNSNGKVDEYWVRRYNEIVEAIEDLGGVEEFVKTWNTVEYSVKDMRKDLREISTALKNVERV
jgi:hypothetical protein